MERYTEKDLETFERDEWGRLICPSGDYTQVRDFPERCSFAELCIFEKNLYFDGILYPDKSVVKIYSISSRDGCAYFSNKASGIYVACGRFYGTIDEFEAKVNETHANNEQYRKEYLLAIEYIKAIMQ